MSQNYLNLLINELESRWDEITTLLKAAEDHKETNVALHDAICRSVTVLMVANLEGFYKDLIRNTIDDLNDNYRFNELSEAIQRHYCSKFLDSQSTDKARNTLTNILIEEFKVLNSNINFKPFLYSKNNNPKPQVIEMLFNNLGINIVFQILKSSRYELVFSEGNSYLEDKISEYTHELHNCSLNFPYQYTSKSFNILTNTSKQRKERTLWEEFLDQLNKRRHEVAHGNDLRNIDSVEHLTFQKNKIIFLQLALIHIIIEEFGTYTAIYRPRSISLVSILVPN
ncbi:MAE_28990/MAE_18760 family HEPN-like nuclease [Psychrobacter sp. APC 3281]|uniref:MAE_28990/MAE_18760 family HEPN-like nuclease n=1 Tax=Psychrobacter sp. APC 3281 TaxID=3035190 RepID=UPI0025B2A6D2|nr:MAE_28990/MAE_18760 family HEPN-like nuclease [Psychrobacter sp. APC 3281]MDN3447990.1 MAE_28990/MAE_18760 family HEPN-like nuclease [Psychrobacter sp. APC 3281]